MDNAPAIRQLRLVERELAEGRPFGHVTHINDLNDQLYLQRLSLYESALPSASRLIENLRQQPSDRVHYFLRDPALRIGVDMGLLHTRGLAARYTIDWTDKLFDLAVSMLESGCQQSLLESRQSSIEKLSRRPLSAYLWNSPSADSVSQCVKDLVYEIVPDAHIDCPTRDQIHTLRSAVTLLERSLPRLAPSALNHASVVVLVSERANPGSGHTGFQSGTARNLPGVLLLSTSELTTPWRAAESLLHEALHLKFIDLEFTHSMSLKIAGESNAETIRPPWRNLGIGEGWLPIRAMTAAHVYLGLALFYGVNQLPTEPINRDLGCPPDIELQEALQNAHYRSRFLLSALENELQCLGLAGQYFVKWLIGLHTPKALGFHANVG